MPGIDPHTLVIIVSFQCLLVSFVLAAMRASFPRTIGGIGLWALAMPLFVAASVLYSLQETSPLIHVLLANSVFLTALLLLCGALRSFYGLPQPRPAMLAGFFVAVMGALAWLTFIQPSFPLRLTMMSLVGVALFGHLAWLPLRLGRRSTGSVITGLSFGWTSLSCLLRVVSMWGDFDRPDALLDLSLLQVIYLASFNVSLLLGSVGFILLINERLRRVLEYSASYDTLTGILNRGAFFKAAQKAFEHCRRTGRPLSVALLDLDHFKQINDSHGHAAGDRVLKAFCLRVQTVLRSTDLLGRYGGEEFVLLLPNTRSEDALHIAQRLRDAVGAAREALPYTVSIGLATLDTDSSTLDELLVRADKALYRAKESGRDRIEQWTP